MKNKQIFMKLFLKIFLLFVLNVLYYCECNERPNPSKDALKCLINNVYNREEFTKCGTQLSHKWNLNDEGIQDVRQKCCSIFDLFNCIDVLAQKYCKNEEYLDVMEYKHRTIHLANNNECKDYKYLSDECSGNVIAN